MISAKEAVSIAKKELPGHTVLRSIYEGNVNFYVCIVPESYNDRIWYGGFIGVNKKTGEAFGYNQAEDLGQAIRESKLIYEIEESKLPPSFKEKLLMLENK